MHPPDGPVRTPPLDDALARVLADARRQTAVAGPSCLDAETLAAWQDGTLSSAEAQVAEAHLAGCARCTAMLAAVARAADAEADLASAAATAPATDRTVPRGPAVRHARWLVPLAAAAAVAGIWIARPDPTPAPVPTDVLARAERTPDAAAPPSDDPAARESAVPAAPAPAARVERDRLLESVRTQKTEGLGGTAAGSVASNEFARAGAEAREVAEAPAVGEAASLGARTPARQTATAPAAPPPAESERRETLADARGTTAPAAAPPPQGFAPVAQARLAASADTSRVDVAGPSGVPTWRVNARGVEVLTGAGVVNAALPALDPAARLTGGHAPSADVVWIVGTGGVILRATDARTFARVPFPAAIDLLSVRAADARRAVVTAADGRSFRTDDGGVTWVPGTN